MYGDISFFIYGCSILIEFIILALVFTVAETIHPSKTSYSTINVFVATMLMSMILYAIVYGFSKSLGEFEIDQVGENGPGLDALIYFGNELWIVALAVLVSYSLTIASIALPKQLFEMEGMIIRKALMVFGTAILCVLAIMFIDTDSKFLMAMILVSIRLILEIIKLGIELKT